jgi:hypothetical protein
VPEVVKEIGLKQISGALVKKKKTFCTRNFADKSAIFNKSLKLFGFRLDPPSTLFGKCPN